MNFLALTYDAPADATVKHRLTFSHPLVPTTQPDFAHALHGQDAVLLQLSKPWPGTARTLQISWGLFRAFKPIMRTMPHLEWIVLARKDADEEVAEKFNAAGWQVITYVDGARIIPVGSLVQTMRRQIALRNRSGSNLRVVHPPSQDSLSFGSSGKAILTIAGKELPLNNAPARVLASVLSFGVVSNDYLFESHFGNLERTRKIFHVQVHHLNAAMKRCFGSIAQIKSEWGIGYRWDGPPVRCDAYAQGTPLLDLAVA